MDSPAHAKDYFIQPLKKYSVKDVITKENYAVPIKLDDPLYEMIKIFFNSNFLMHPVVDENDKIVGMIKYDRIKNIMLTSPDDPKLAKDLMETDVIPKVKLNETLGIVVHNFFRKKTDELFVIDDATQKYVGIIRKRDVLSVIEGAEENIKKS